MSGSRHGKMEVSIKDDLLENSDRTYVSCSLLGIQTRWGSAKLLPA